MTRVHHSAICVHDVDESLRFYREGLGLTVLMDQEFEGDWPALFDAPSRRLRSVFLGDPAAPNAGVVELVRVADSGAVATAAPVAPGFLLLSFFVDVEAVLSRLAGLGLTRDTRRIEVAAPTGAVAMATVRDPDGVLVELVGA